MNIEVILIQPGIPRIITIPTLDAVLSKRKGKKNLHVLVTLKLVTRMKLVA